MKNESRQRAGGLSYSSINLRSSNARLFIAAILGYDTWTFGQWHFVTNADRRPFSE
jgi:hypothetical protein